MVVDNEGHSGVTDRSTSTLRLATDASGGTQVYLRGGELQYFRVRRELWRPALRKLREAEFNAVSTCIPWILHEPEEGQFDFEGRAGEYSDLIGFLEVCQEAGMPVMVRPGPQIYAEFDGFGQPHWLGYKYPECVMRGPRGGLVGGSYYVFYSLLHPTYLQKVENWYQHLIRVLWPQFEDVIISFQLDNETGMPFGNTLGNFDFNPDTVTRFQAFLRVRYGEEIAKLNACWGTSYTSFEAILPPKRKLATGPATDWYDFFEDFVVEFLHTLRGIAARYGVQVPFVLNDLDLYLSPAAPSKKRQVAEVQGFDLYIKGSGKAVTADYPFGPSHHPERFAALIGDEARVMSLEVGAGWFDPRAWVSPEATLLATMGSIAHGIHGHCYYVAHDGRDPSGSPYAFRSFFDEYGAPLPRLAVASSIHRFLTEHESELLASHASYDDIVYLTYQRYSRFMPADFLPGQFLPDPQRFLESIGSFGLYDVLVTAGFMPRFVDLQHVTVDELARAQIVIFPTRGWVDKHACERLVQYVRRGGHLITFPTIVTTDEYGHPLETATALYPRGIASSSRLGLGTVARRLLIDFVGKYLLFERWKLRRREPTAMQNTDAFEGLKVLLNQKLPAAVLTADDGTRVRGDYITVRFQPMDVDQRGSGKMQNNLGLRGACAGYTVRYPEGGSTTVIGTVPGGAYTTGVYYQLLESEREELRRYVSSIMRGHGVEPQWTATIEIECVLRTSPRGTLLFIINRLGTQVGELQLATNEKQWTTLDYIWTFGGSSVGLRKANILWLDLQPNDVVVVRLREAEGSSNPL